MRSPFHYLTQALGNPCKRALVEVRSRRKCNRQTSYETMEPRRLLAGIEFLTDTSQVLIGGTAQPDSASVVERNGQLIVSQSGFPTRTFQASGIHSILFVGLGGDDYFRNATSKPSFAWGGSGEDTLIGGSSRDRLIGNSQNDFISGNGGDDYLVGGVGDDRVSGGGGNDRILGVSGTNFLNGNAGEDQIFGGSNRDIITGGDGDDVLAGSDGDDVIFAKAGNDLIFGGSGRDRLLGEGGNDRIYGQSGDDTLLGGLGADLMFGNGGNDNFTGEFGNDRIRGGQGDDRATFSGLFSDYNIDFNGGNATVSDTRGAGGDATDSLIGIDQLVFSNAFQNSGAAPVFTGPQPEQPEEPEVNNDQVVTIQPIVLSNDDGSNTAEFLGNAAQEADVKQKVDAIYAQAGIDVLWLPAVTWDNTNVNVGDNGNTGDPNDPGGGPDGPGGERPQGDLAEILTEGDDAGFGSADPLVIDMYFVELVPGFDDPGENTANGLARLGDAGVAIHIGDNLPATEQGRVVISEVVAHEIGHNLGLEHLEVVGNLLAPGGFDNGGSDLTDEQIIIALNSPLSR